LYAERQAAGFCGYCGKNIPDGNKKTCEKCLATMRKYDRWAYNEKQEVPDLGE
jgi:predicted nucleic acid-binding Zn ribbon protein